MPLPLQASEAFLQRMTALFVASHYRNTPNDLILMSDAPAHNLFALVGPVDETQVPDCGGSRWMCIPDGKTHALCLACSFLAEVP